MPSCCSIKQCSARRSKHYPQLTLHLIPKNEALRQMWLKAVGTDNLNPRHKEKRLCSLHFDESQFNRSLNVIRLRDNAVPTHILTDQEKIPKQVVTETNFSSRRVLDEMPSVSEEVHFVSEISNVQKKGVPVTNVMLGAQPQLHKTPSVSEEVHVVSEISNVQRKGVPVTNEMLGAQPQRHKTPSVSEEVQFVSEISNVQKKGVPVTNEMLGAQPQLHKTMKRPVKQLGVNDTSHPQVKCCRACLATDCKLYHMREHNLVEEFYRVTGFYGQTAFSIYLCVWCTSLVRSFAAFRDKCRRANSCVLPLLTTGTLTLESIRSIHRSTKRLTNLIQTDVETTDSFYKPSVPQKQCLIPTLNNNDDTVIELDGTEANNTLHNKLFVQIDSGNTNDIQLQLVKEDDLQIHGETIIVQDDDMEPEYIYVTDHDHNYDSVPILTENGEMHNGKAAKRRRITQHKTSMRSIPEFDVKKFEKTYNVDFVILTQSEQLAEIEARRATQEYQEAKYRCHPCGKYFRAQETLDSHKPKHTMEAGNYECPICTVHVWKYMHLRKHSAASHFYKIICRACGSISRNKEQATAHYKWHEGQRYQCGYCGKVFNKRNTRFNHIRLAHPSKNMACNMCGETFINEKGLRMHKMLEHRVPTNENLLQCELCSVTFISLNALEKHRDVADDHADLAPCILCGENFCSEDKMQEHTMSAHPSCQECQITFLNEESYDTHVTRKHLGLGRPLCKMQAANRRARKLGMPAPYKQKQYIYPRGEPGPQQCCEQCGKMFKCAALLRQHQRIAHEGAYPLNCSFCPKGFTSTQNLESHVRTHTGETPFQCDQCPKAFKIKSNLDRHFKTAHLKIYNRWPCPICGRQLSTRSAVPVHIREVHYGLRPKRNRKRKLQNEAPQLPPSPPPPASLPFPPSPQSPPSPYSDSSSE